MQFGLKNGGSYRIKYISIDNDNDVVVRVFGLVSVSEEQRLSMLELINEINAEYRYIKLCCDDDGEINIEYDFQLSSSHPEDSATEIVSRFVKIIDEIYPRLMRALWK